MLVGHIRKYLPDGWLVDIASKHGDAADFGIAGQVELKMADFSVVSRKRGLHYFQAKRCDVLLHLARTCQSVE